MMLPNLLFGGFQLPSLSGIFQGNPLKNIWNGIKTGFQTLFGGVSPYSLGQDIYNIYEQQQNNLRTMNLQQMLWERDDNSLSRLMKQYQDNNINPLMALPNISQGNTKGFETSAIQSKANIEAERLAREQYRLSKQRQELELRIMSNQDKRAESEHSSKIQTEALERRILNSRLNGAKAYANVYGAGLGDFGEDGYIPPFALNNVEKIISALGTFLDNYDKNKSNLPKAGFMQTTSDEVKKDPEINTPNPFRPTTHKYEGYEFVYNAQDNTYDFMGQKYYDLERLKSRIRWQKDFDARQKAEKRQSKMFQHPNSWYEPAWKNPTNSFN